MAFHAPRPAAWEAVHGQATRWLRAGCFDVLAQDLRAVLRVAGARRPEPTAAVLDSRTLRSTPESGARAGYDGAKRKKGSKVHLAVDTPGHLLALHATPADADDRSAVGKPARDVQDATGNSVEAAFVDQGFTGERPAGAAAAHGIRLEVVRLPEAKRGFVPLPKRWAVERSFAWATRFRRLAKDYERLHQALADMHTVAFACLMLKRPADLAMVHNTLLCARASDASSRRSAAVRSIATAVLPILQSLRPQPKSEELPGEGIRANPTSVLWRDSNQPDFTAGGFGRCYISPATRFDRQPPDGQRNGHARRHRLPDRPLCSPLADRCSCEWFM